MNQIHYMHSHKLSLASLLATAAVVVVLCDTIACNVLQNRNRRLSSAELSTGKGSSGSIAHKTWTQYGGGADQSKYVDLRKITRRNVNELEIAWTYATSDNVASYRFNPVIVDNIMYVLAKNIEEGCRQKQTSHRTPH